MRRVVHKWAVPIPGLQLVLAAPRLVHIGPDPTGALALPHVWIEHAPDGLEKTHLRLSFVGTGMEIHNDRLDHVGSCIDFRLGLVWHVYQETP